METMDWTLNSLGKNWTEKRRKSNS